MGDAWSDVIKGSSYNKNLRIYEIQKKLESTMIRRGDVVMLKSKYHGYYKKNYNPVIVDITKPARVLKVSGSGKIYLEGWEEIHDKKKGKGFPETSFDKLSERQIKIFDIYKPEPIVTKSIGQIQDCNDKSFTLFIFSDENIVNVYPNELLMDVAAIEKGTYITIVSTITQGKQIVEFTQSTDDEINLHISSL